jgi:hypothetical protein
MQFVAVSALIIGVGDPIAWRLAFGAFALGLLALGDYVRRAIAIGRSHLHEEKKP